MGIRVVVVCAGVLFRAGDGVHVWVMFRAGVLVLGGRAWF